MASPTATHILVIPFPAQGHTIPLLDLAHRLLTGGLIVTVVVTPENLPLLQPLLSRHPATALSGLVLPAGGGQPPASFQSLLTSLTSLKDPLLRWFATHPSPPSAIISDILLSWTHPLASYLGIKRVVFSPTAAFSLAVTFSVRQSFPPLPTAQNGEIDENGVVLVDPLRSKFYCWELMPFYRAFACTDQNSDSWRREVCSNNIGSWGFVFNTFDAMERVYVSLMKSLAGHNRIWAVGPLFPSENEGAYGLSVRDGSGTFEEVLSWLDTCEDAQVVYVSFGAQIMLTQEQIEVVASALEKSGTRFVWKVNEPAFGDGDGQMHGKLPLGFEDRVAGRGLIIRRWAPQVMILKHKAVGSFLTHCGWNAVLEGLGAGVPLLAWPLVGDQIFNAKLVVEKLKVGVMVGQGMSRLIPDPNELAKILVESVSGGFAEERARAMQLKSEAMEAVSEGGSSFKQLDMFVQHLIQLPKPHPDVIQKCQTWLEEQDQMTNGST